MIINCKVSDKTCIEAADSIVLLMKDNHFLMLVSEIESFNETKHSGKEVAHTIKSANFTVNIVPYKTTNPYSSVIGYASGNTVYVNTRKLGLSFKDRASNFMHEILHLMDYSHNGNYNNSYNQNTVPYRVGDLFGEYANTRRDMSRLKIRMSYL